MLKLLKYEIRKTRGLKLGLLVMTVIFELVYLYGLLTTKSDVVATGILGLTMIALVGVILVGFNSIQLLYRELTSKQSYMMFMTPHNSFKILGAKILEGAISFYLTGFIFCVLALLDMYLLADIFEESSLFFFASFFGLANANPVEVLSVVLDLVGSFLYMFVIGCFAIILSKTIFKESKYAGMFSWVLFFGLNFALTYLLGKVFPTSMDTNTLIIHSLVQILIAVIFYFVSCVLMERKLSV